MSRSCWPSWPTCATLLEDLAIQQRSWADTKRPAWRARPCWHSITLSLLAFLLACLAPTGGGCRACRGSASAVCTHRRRGLDTDR